MKAIETTYKGRRFRSRLEARWAVFFDALGIAWQYEPEGFQALDGTRYLPDFFLPKISGGIFVEVKGCDNFDWALFDKPIKMVQQGLAPVLCLFGQPELRFYKLVSAAMENGEIVGWDDAWACFKATDLHVCEDPAPSNTDNMLLEQTLITEAIEAAVGARFEHGESGASR